MTSPPATRPAATEPTIHRHLLGQQLREFRAARALRLEDAAAAIGITPSTLSRIETGKAPARASYISVLLDLYDVADPRQRAQLTAMARDGQRQSPWTTSSDLMPATARHYLGLEAAARRLRTYSSLAVPDLLQTLDYATAACAAANPGLNPDQICELAQMTLRRQEVLCDQQRHYHFILDEAALQRSIAPRPVMNAQLEHLSALTGAPNITIQAASLTPAPPLLAPPFTILTLPGTTPEAAAWHGYAGHHKLVTRSADLTRLHHAFTLLAQTAMPPADTSSLIAGLAG